MSYEIFNGGKIHRDVRNILGASVATINDGTLVLTANTTLTLPTITASNVGFELKVINRGGYTLTINGNGSDLVNGSVSFTPVGAGVVDLKATALLTWDAEFSDADGATNFVTLTEAAFLALVAGNTLVEGQKYEITNAGYIEPAYLLATTTNTYVNIGNSGVAQYDVTGLSNFDLAGISLAKKIRLTTTGTTETGGNILNNIVSYGNELFGIQNTVTKVSSGLENKGTGMFVGTPFKLNRRNYNGVVIPGVDIAIFENSNLLIEGVDYNVVDYADGYTRIDPLVSYPASFIEADYLYIPNTKIIWNRTSVFDAITYLATDAITTDFNTTNVVFAYGTNTEDNESVTIVRGPQYNVMTKVNKISDINNYEIIGSAHDQAFNVSFSEFMSLIAAGELIYGRVYQLVGSYVNQLPKVQAISNVDRAPKLNQEGRLSGSATIDTATFLAAGILDISEARYGGTITVNNGSPSMTLLGLTGGIEGYTYRILFEGAFGVHVFGKELADTIATSIILKDSDYSFFQGNAVSVQSDILTVQLINGMYVQVADGLRPFLSKEVAISNHEFMRVSDVGQIQYVAVAGGSNVNTTVLTDNQLGIVNSNIGAGATSRAGWGGEVGSNRLRISTLPTVRKGGFTIEVNLSSLANPYIYRHGLMDNLTTASLQACQFVHNETSINWMIRTAAGGVVTNIDSGYVVTAGVNYKTLIVATDTEVHFAMGVYGSSMNYLGSITTNIPTPVFGILSYGAFAIKTAAGGLNTISSDYYSLSKYVNR